MRATPDLSMFARHSTPLPMVYEMGGGGPERARLVCCFLGCDERPFNPLITALPPVIHLSGSGERAATGWLATMIRSRCFGASDQNAGWIGTA